MYEIIVRCDVVHMWRTLTGELSFLAESDEGTEVPVLAEVAEDVDCVVLANVAGVWKGKGLDSRSFLFASSCSFSRARSCSTVIPSLSIY